MALFDAPAREVQHHARRAAHEASPGVQRLARLGYAAKGVVYLIIGGIAAQAAFSPAEQVEGTEGALTHHPAAAVRQGAAGDHGAGAGGLRGLASWCRR